MDGLGQDFELVALCACFLQEVGGSCLSGEEEDFAFGQLGAGEDSCLDTGHAGHDDVADEHVGLEGVESFDGLFSAEYGARFKASLIEDDREGVCDDLFIVCDEDSGLGRGAGGCI